MALIFDRRVPAGIIDKARSILGDLAAVPDSRGGQSPLSKAIVSNTPLPVYSLRLDALAGGLGPWDAGLADAEPESWRVFVMMNGRNEPTGVADVTSSPREAGGARFLSYTRGPQVAASGQVLTDAEDTEPLRSRTFQPGFLEIPGINVSAVWLKALDGQGDVVIPVDPIPRFLSDRHNYTLREFLELARARAVQRLKFNNSPRGDGPNPPLVQAPHPGQLQHETVALGGLTDFPLDVSETENEFVVKASLPGIKPDDVQITVHGDTLTIRGESKVEEEEKGVHWHTRERRSGVFQWSLSLSAPVDSDKAQAAFEHGVLTITLPKSEAAKPRQIKIGAAQGQVAQDKVKK